MSCTLAAPPGTDDCPGIVYGKGKRAICLPLGAASFAEMSTDTWRYNMALNLDGVFYLCRRAIPALRANSAIVNLTSVAAHRGAYANAHYGTSKGGLLSLTRALARELGPQTRVNAVSPGIIETPMTQALIATRGTADWLRAQGVKAEAVNKVYEGRPNIVDRLKNGDIALVMNTTEGTQAINDSRDIRRVALMDKIPYFTTAAASIAAVAAMKARGEGYGVRTLQG